MSQLHTSFTVPVHVQDSTEQKQHDRHYYHNSFFYEQTSRQGLLAIGHFTVICSVTGLFMAARLENILIYTTKAARSLSKQGHSQHRHLYWPFSKQWLHILNTCTCMAKLTTCVIRAHLQNQQHHLQDFVSILSSSQFPLFVSLFPDYLHYTGHKPTQHISDIYIKIY